MDAREIIKDIMNANVNTKAQLPRKMDITQANIRKRLNNRKVRIDISVSLLKTMSEALGYKIMIVPKETPIPEGGYEVGRTDMVG